jgi:hypothetical protein
MLTGCLNVAIIESDTYSGQLAWKDDSNFGAQPQEVAKYLRIWPDKSDNILTDRHNRHISILFLRKVAGYTQACYGDCLSHRTGF